MQLKIKNISALAPGLESPEQWLAWAKQPVFDYFGNHSDNHLKNQTSNGDGAVSVPKLDFMPMMQRRRLSKFARICCYTLHHLNAVDNSQIVFASRFGDLQKATELIDNVAAKKPLSPAQFGLSVHNAVAGQYSIFSGNKQPSSTISAGIDSFHMGLVEAFSRLEQSTAAELVMVCTETITPPLYDRYINHQQIDHSVAILLSKNQGQALTLNLTGSGLTASKPLPQALQFMAWYYSAANTTMIAGARRQWHWQKGH